MNKLVGSILLMGVMGVLSGCLDTGGDRVPDTPTPDAPVVPKPDNTYGFENTIPQTITNPQHKAQLAEVAEAYARVLQTDGRLDEPVITTTKLVEERLKAMMLYAYNGQVLATPEFAEAFSIVMTEHLEGGDQVSTGRELTTELRLTAIEIFEALAWSLKK